MPSYADYCKCVALIIALCTQSVQSILCYTCAGHCFSDNQECNCQMNRCEASHCFTEVTLRAPSVHHSEPSFFLVKGCLKKPPEVEMGCDYRFSRDIVRCVCNEGDFCNQHAALPVYTRAYERWNISCHKCGGARGGYNCGTSCQGQYCYYELTSGTQQCAFGAPTLPFTYRSPQLFGNAQQRTCVSTEMATQSRAECVCNSHVCNAIDTSTLRYPVTRSALPSESSQSVRSQSQARPPVYQCYSCQKTVSANDALMPVDCQDQSETCWGDFCFISVETRPAGRQSLKTMSSRKVGCVNSTSPELLNMGCSQKWEEARYEQIDCVCRGDFCNRDLHTAHVNGAIRVGLDGTVGAWVGLLMIGWALGGWHWL